MRPRISQMLVLPPFQKQGLGAKLLDTVSKYYWNNPKIVDITGMNIFEYMHPQAFFINLVVLALFYSYFIFLEL